MPRDSAAADRPASYLVGTAAAFLLFFRDRTKLINQLPFSPSAKFPKSGSSCESRARGAAMTGTDVATYARERPGMSTFVLEDGAVYHTYSTFARGLDGLWGAYQWLDRAPKGRNDGAGYWWRHHDEYDKH